MGVITRLTNRFWPGRTDRKAPARKTEQAPQDRTTLSDSRPRRWKWLRYGVMAALCAGMMATALPGAAVAATDPPVCPIEISQTLSAEEAGWGMGFGNGFEVQRSEVGVISASQAKNIAYHGNGVFTAEAVDGSLAISVPPGADQMGDFSPLATGGEVVACRNGEGVTVVGGAETFAFDQHGTLTATDASGTVISFPAGQASQGFQIPLGMILTVGMLGYLGWNISKAVGQAGAMSKGHQVEITRPNVTFDDVAGAEGAKDEMMMMVDFLKNPSKYTSRGAKIPRGALLVGPPGTGKTLLARAVAGEAGVSFFSVSGSEFVEMYVGRGAARVRDLFDQAKEKSPCIVFIDEIDAVGKARSSGGGGRVGGSNDEQEQTLNQLLTEMDGFEGNSGVIVLAATNRPDILDPALKRAGRFDTQVTVGEPTLEARERILQVHSRGKILDEDVNLRWVAERTPGLVGADLENIMNKAAITAAKKDLPGITQAELEEAIDTVALGPERKSDLLTPFEKRFTAYHEAGHALIAQALPSNGILHKVTILPRGKAMGVTWTVPEEEKHSQTKTEMLDRICMLMGGRAAEELKFGHFSSGASNDIERATEIAKHMVITYGMDEQVGARKINLKIDGDQASEQTRQLVDRKIDQILEQQYDRAKQILTTNDSVFVQLSEELSVEEEISREALQQRLKGKVSLPA